MIFSFIDCKKKVLLILFFLCYLNVYAQNHLLGFKGGIFWSNRTTKDIEQNFDYRTGISSGVTYEYLSNKHFSFIAELIYNQRGFSTNIEILDSVNSIKIYTDFKFDYLSFPLKTAFNFGEKIFGYTQIGLVPSFIVNAKMKNRFITVGQGGDVLDTSGTTNDLIYGVTKFDLAGIVEIGGGYKLKDRIWFYSSFAFQHSFTFVTKSDYYPKSNIRIYGMNLSFGIKYVLGKD